MRLLPRVDGLTAVKAMPWMARHGCLETSARNLLLQRRTQGARARLTGDVRQQKDKCHGRGRSENTDVDQGL
jgi:hypothetical protein